MNDDSLTYSSFIIVFPSVALSVNLGQGGAGVHLLDVNCTGAESNLLECVESGSGMTPLSLVDGDCSIPAGVICEGKCDKHIQMSASAYIYTLQPTEDRISSKGILLYMCNLIPP